MLTIQILIKNNIQTIQNCLDSIKCLNAKILFGNLGSEDGTFDICKNYGNVFDTDGDFDNIRNNLVNLSETDWQFYINPWEKIVSGQEQILWATVQEDNAFNIYSIQESVILNQTRLWRKNKCKFVQPVYESLEPQATKQISAVISGSGSYETRNKLIEWKKTNPNSSIVDYYLALDYLMEDNYDLFIDSAEIFLFKARDVNSVILIKYYLAMVYLFVKRNPERAYRQLFYCLVKNPTLAEFWCLLGDIFFAKNQHKRSLAFYENAIIFGKRRKPDTLPIEVLKYKDYPEKMIIKCNERLQ